MRIQKTSAETSIDIRQNIHAETSFVRTKKTPTDISLNRIQKSSAETSMDIGITCRVIYCQNREDSNRDISC